MRVRTVFFFILILFVGGGVHAASDVAAPRPSNSGNISVCADNGTTDGIDVSDSEKDFQWNTLSGEGVQFMFIKATEGITFINPLFALDWPAAKDSGFVRGAYHYFRPDDDPIDQANAFLQVIGTLGDDDLPPVLDWEVTDKVPSDKQIQSALTWLTTVEKATGKTPILYTYLSFWNELGNPQGFDRFPLWIAYTDDAECPLIPPPWNSWLMWQYSADQPLNGITAKSVDRDTLNGAVSAAIGIARSL